MPEPPGEPLPKLAALSRLPPSPLLQWQALQLLYAYCLTLRTYHGDWRADPLVRPLIALLPACQSLYPHF